MVEKSSATTSSSVTKNLALAQAILDSLPEHVAVLDNTGVILTVNESWRNFGAKNGISREGVDPNIGLNYLDICRNAAGDCAEEAGLICAGIDKVLQGKTNLFELEYPCHSPMERRWFLLQAAPLNYPGGGAVISHFNITERRSLELRLNNALVEAEKAKEQAESANHTKDEFIAQVSHDLRSPLGAMQGWAKLLLSATANQFEREYAINSIIESADKQNRLIEDLLDISRVTSGKIRLHLAPVSLQTMIQSALEVMKPACSAKRIELTTEYLANYDIVNGDAARLEQVMWNLLSNAMKFTPPQGKVNVQIINEGEAGLRITVTDTGRGIASEHLPFVFERYWQPEMPDNAGHKGLGLGLAMVKNLVELHGGSITAHSEGTNRGATFCIVLPKYEQRYEVSAKADESEIKPFPDTSTVFADLTIVVVDDEQPNCDLVAEILRRQGARVLTAHSAFDAFEIFSRGEHSLALLVSDINMADENGYDLLRKIRQLPPEKGAAIPAIALTALTRMQDRIKALKTGFQMHLPKPIQPQELLLVAANLTGRKFPTNEN